VTSSLDELVDVLGTQAAGLRRLLPLLQAQERTLLAADARGALALAERQAPLTSELRALERRRQSIVARVAGELGLPGDTLSLSTLLTRIRPAPPALRRLGEELREVGGRVAVLSRRNTFLLERSIGYVSDLLRTVVAATAPPTTTYAASGRAEGRAAATLRVVDRRA
jgi:flagellar biosynthesis/type III secretory pathway chaperone